MNHKRGGGKNGVDRSSTFMAGCPRPTVTSICSIPRRPCGFRINGRLFLFGRKGLYRYRLGVVPLWAVDSDCILTLQSLCAFYAAVTGKGKMPGKEAEAQINDWLELFPVAFTTPKSLVKALRAVREHRLSFRDALIWAVVAEAGAILLVSEDFPHTRVLGGVQFYNSFAMENPLAEVFKIPTEN